MPKVITAAFVVLLIGLVAGSPTEAGHAVRLAIPHIVEGARIAADAAGTALGWVGGILHRAAGAR